MDKQTRKQIQRLLSNADWPALEKFFKQYMVDNFLLSSFKKPSEFDTMWYIAYGEGGREHLNKFFEELEKEAHLADE